VVLLFSPARQAAIKLTTNKVMVRQVFNKPHHLRLLVQVEEK
jgi:hypothetical protein